MFDPLRGFRRRLRRKIVRSHLDSFMSHHRTNECVLDLGCGDSRYSHYFPNRIGLDHSMQEGVNVVGDAHRLPFLSSSFSIILTTEMLEHVHNPQQVIDEIERVLRPGGKVILTTRFVFPIHEAPMDFYRFTKYGLAYLFRRWVKVEIRPETHPFEGIGVLFQRMAYQSDFRGSKVISYACLLLARFMSMLDVLVARQYGDIKRQSQETEIITSGYYLVAHKV